MEDLLTQVVGLTGAPGVLGALAFLLLRVEQLHRRVAVHEATVQNVVARLAAVEAQWERLPRRVRKQRAKPVQSADATATATVRAV